VRSARKSEKSGRCEGGLATLDYEPVTSSLPSLFNCAPRFEVPMSEHVGSRRAQARSPMSSLQRRIALTDTRVAFINSTAASLRAQLWELNELRNRVRRWRGHAFRAAVTSEFDPEQQRRMVDESSSRQRHHRVIESSLTLPLDAGSHCVLIRTIIDHF